jgi:DNA-3-methyladenine glycosylase II
MTQSQGQLRTPADSASSRTLSVHELRVVTPYRLDLTVSALRRLSTNVVDVLTPDGHYMRALAGASGPVIVHVAQLRGDTLRVTIDGVASDHALALGLVQRMLGVDRDLAHFELAAARLDWLRELAHRMHGVKPPRYPTLWEAFVNTIAFQQVSLEAASAITRRLIVAFGRPIEREGVLLYAFPGVEQVLSANDTSLRTVGFSAGKLATLRRVGEALAARTLDEAMLEEQSSADASATLQRIKGLGPWTAAVILLRGLGRLDVFPLRDTSVARNLALVGGGASLDVAAIVDALRPQQGMLYYHLLLARLESRGEVGAPSVSLGMD